MSPDSSKTSIDPVPNTGGIVLCGGKSSRMGTSKAWLKFGDEFMLQRITRILSSVVTPVVVVSAPDQELPEISSSCVLCQDEFPDLGPLSGIHSGLKKLSELGVELAFVTACDCPFLQTSWIRFLSAQMTNDLDLVLVQDENYRYVLSALYRTDLFRTAKELLDENKLRPIQISNQCRTQLINIDQAKTADPELLSLLNLNTPDEYQQALDRFALDTRD